MALIELSEFKTVLGITDASQDDRLQSLLDSAILYFENKTERLTFPLNTHIRTMCGSDDAFIYVPEAPIAMPVYGTDSWVKRDDVLIPEEDIRFDADSGEIEITDGTIFGSGDEIEVKYVGGWADEDFPLDLSNGIMELARGNYNREQAKGTLTEEAVEDHKRKWTDPNKTMGVGQGGNSSSVQDIICLYRIENL